MHQGACPICATRGTGGLPLIVGFEGNGYDCPRCGHFYLTGTAVATLEGHLATGRIDRSVLSHHVRKMYDEKTQSCILRDQDLAAYIGDNSVPNPQEQLESLILWIGKSQRSHSEPAVTRQPPLAARIGSAVTIDRSDEPDLAWLLAQVKEPPLVTIESSPLESGALAFRLTMDGWKYFADLNRRAVESHRAFMAMKFDDPVLDRVLKDCFKPAAAQAGFDLRAVNELQPAGLIDNQIRAGIRAARFVVADLTHDSYGAYFEAGFAEGMGLPVIYTCEALKFKQKSTHFDTNHMHTVLWEDGKLAQAQKVLTATIRNTLPGEAKLDDS